MGTFGELVVSGETFYTVERPWHNNRPFVSCVPLGEYDLIWQPTTTQVPEEFGDLTWYLRGETVSEKIVSQKPRTRCCFHVANKFEDVNGCIGLGNGLGAFSARMWAVKNSIVALNDLLSLVGGRDHSLTIAGSEMG